MILFDNYKKKSLIKKGIELLKRGMYEESLDYFDKALKIDYNNSKVWEMKATALKVLQRNEEALESVNIASKN